jgi:hypothetical protein
MRSSIIALCLLVPYPAQCQEYSSALGKGKINKDFCLRAEAGWNKSWFASLGASYVYSNVNDHAPMSMVVYAAAEANLAGYRSPNAFYGYKAGFETAGLPFALGLELRNNTDFSGNDQFVFTPKLGLSLFSYVNLFYGYNVYDKNKNLFGIGRSQLSFSININRSVLKGNWGPAAEKK